MRSVSVFNSKSLDPEERFLREAECWKHWNLLTDSQKDMLVRTVESEMRRLAETVPNWLPASARKVNGTIEILISLTTDEIGITEVDKKFLTDFERAEAAGAVQSLSEMLESLEED